jgi:hypothetical protein
MINDRIINLYCWRYVESDDDFIRLYGPDADPPDEEFPLAVYQLDSNLFVYMSEDEAFRMFFSLNEYDYDK